MGKGPGEGTEDLRQLHQQIQDTVRSLGERAKSGDKVAAEMLRSMAQSVVRAAGIATEPGISKARRALLLTELLKKLEKVD